MSNEKTSPKKSSKPVSSEDKKTASTTQATSVVDDAAVSTSQSSDAPVLIGPDNGETSIDDDTAQSLLSAPESHAATKTVVCEVSARPEQGFWRCGRKWLNEPCHVVVDDESVGQSDPEFITSDELLRLRSEPKLIVTLVETEE
ncbi:Putative uncharacterized protein [Moritella viscosa]|uniref:hypothetical protein n=1 Tax=Moritella viscosa TaxID=80854 RepID=UPI00091272E3|nr:hypothetical protein [Moritella viscosa]SHO20109.1 Putative uncharacterized protein [Moritella viscosa]